MPADQLPVPESAHFYQEDARSDDATLNAVIGVFFSPSGVAGGGLAAAARVFRSLDGGRTFHELAVQAESLPVAIGTSGVLHVNLMMVAANPWASIRFTDGQIRLSTPGSDAGDVWFSKVERPTQMNVVRHFDAALVESADSSVLLRWERSPNDDSTARVDYRPWLYSGTSDHMTGHPVRLIEFDGGHPLLTASYSLYGAGADPLFSLEMEWGNVYGARVGGQALKSPTIQIPARAVFAELEPRPDVRAVGPVLALRREGAQADPVALLTPPDPTGHGGGGSHNARSGKTDRAHHAPPPTATPSIPAW